jgi:hypothetical protein
MTAAMRTLQRTGLYPGVFLSVIMAHYVLTGLFPDRDPAAVRWAMVGAAAAPTWMQLYLDSQSYWLGFSYALSLTFAVYAFRRYREQRYGAARNLAIGGATFSGLLALAACYLIGCCGSPMLAVYLSLFGASFLPIAKPLVAALTALSIFVGWWWLNRRRPAPASETSCAGDSKCSCR